MEAPLDDALSCALFLLLAADRRILDTRQTFRGGIDGSVTDVSGAAIPNAECKPSTTQPALPIPPFSSSAGDYSFEDLPLGAYTVTVTASGFQTLKVDRVPVSAGSLYSLPLRVSVAAAGDHSGSRRRRIGAGYHDHHADDRHTQANGSDIPLNGRDYTQMIALTPGFAGYAGGANGSSMARARNRSTGRLKTRTKRSMVEHHGREPGGRAKHRRRRASAGFGGGISLQTQAGPETGPNPGGTVNLVIKS